MKLYSYQENCLLAIESDPSHSQLVSMPTGTGKTITFLNCAKRKDKKCLILVHREELLTQTYEKAKLVGYEDKEISLITSKDKMNLNKLSIAMVQTLTRNLHKYKHEDIEMMIIDEAHHSTANSYRMVMDHFRIFEDKKFLVGFTATPLRGDGAALGSIYHSHSFKMTLSEATQNGYICPVHGMRVEIHKSLENINTTGGDYDIHDLDKIMNCDSVNKIVADRCEHLSKVPAIIFCTSVDHATKISDLLVSKGRKSACVSYKTSKQDLISTFESLKKGELEFITNAVKLSEGFDYPPIQSVILARPTRSPVLYKQMIGRGLRNSPGKHECFVLEFCGNDPQMICWEDIDQNSTFQSSSIKEQKSRKDAEEIYKSKFPHSTSNDFYANIKVLDVRVSPFKFYECYIRRYCKYKKYHRYVPFQQGFMVGEFRQPKFGPRGLCGYDLYSSMCFWKELYKSFYVWDSGLFGEHQRVLSKTMGSGQEMHALECYLPFYCDIPEHKFAKWYPSEEEPISPRQKSFMKKPFPMSARKAEWFIEDAAIKEAIQRYWIDQIMPIKETARRPNSEMYEMHEEMNNLDKKNEIYTLSGKY